MSVGVQQQLLIVIGVYSYYYFVISLRYASFTRETLLFLYYYYIIALGYEFAGKHYCVLI